MASAAHQVRVETKIGRFDVDGQLAADCREMAGLFADQAVRVATSFWTHFLSAPDVAKKADGDEMDSLVKKILPYLDAKYSDVAGQKWADMVEGFVNEATAEKVSLTTLLSSIAAAASEGHKILVEKVAGEPERLARLAKCLTQATLLEADIFAAHFDLVRAEAERGRRASSATHFQEEIVSAAERTASDSRMIRAQAAEASAAARGMLGKTSEVAAAAEQSALAMRGLRRLAHGERRLLGGGGDLGGLAEHAARGRGGFGGLGADHPAVGGGALGGADDLFLDRKSVV